MNEMQMHMGYFRVNSMNRVFTFFFYLLFVLQIEQWLSMYDDFEKLSNYHTIHGWLLIDLRSFKHMMLNQFSKWVNTFKDHLLHYVENRLSVS